MNRLWRVARRVAAVGGVLLAVLLVVVQWQQWVLRHRAEALLAEVQAVRLNETNWAEMQGIMARWGAWGRADGACSAAQCRYEIVVEDRANRLMEASHSGLGQRLGATGYVLLGGRMMKMNVTLALEDGVVRREGIVLMLHVASRFPARDNPGNYQLIVGLHSIQSLEDAAWDSRQLTDHPNYMATRPGGCTFCLMAKVRFRPQSGQEEVRRLMAFDLSCVTRWHPCKWLDELLPVARQWHLYSQPWGAEPEAEALARADKQDQGPQPTVCHVPVWARVRDAESIQLGELLSIKKLKDEQGVYDEVVLRLDELAKGEPPQISGKTVLLHEHEGAEDANRQIVSLQVGRHYAVDLKWAGSDKVGFDVGRCGMMEVTPELMAELAREAAVHEEFPEAERWVMGSPL